MKITVQSSKAIKPDYDGGDAPPAAFIPLTVFDLISFDDYMFGIHAFHPPSPPTAALEAGLSRALASHREWAGRLVAADPSIGRRRGILLNEAGVRLIEATSDATLETAAMGHAMHHAVSDAFAISRFLVAWGQATRGVAIDDPVRVHDRTSFFVPRHPPRAEFQPSAVILSPSLFSIRLGRDLLAIDSSIVEHPPLDSTHQRRRTRPPGRGI